MPIKGSDVLRYDRMYLPRSLKGLGKAIEKVASEEATKLTSGRPSTPPGRPYSRHLNLMARLLGITRGTAPLLPINSGSGTYRTRNSKRISHNKRDGSFILRFTSKASKYVMAPDGTEVMEDRGFWDELHKRVGRKAVKLKKAHLVAWQSRQPYRIRGIE